MKVLKTLPAKRKSAATNVALPKNLNISNKTVEIPISDLLSLRHSDCDLDVRITPRKSLLISSDGG